jgi:hypothetical protein
MNIQNDCCLKIQNNYFEIIWSNFGETLIAINKKEWGEKDMHKSAKLIEQYERRIKSNQKSVKIDEWGTKVNET